MSEASRRRGRVVRWLAGAALLSASAGCGLLHDGTASAVWELAPDQSIDADTSAFAVVVTRVGCNGGVTGDVTEPDVQYDADRVIVTFAVTPGEPSAADCRGNDQVPYDVELDEPLGDRALVDGQCLSGGEARGTAFCEPDGVRHTP